MQSKEVIQTALERSYAMAMPLLMDLKTAPLVQPTPNGGNHAHWILGHLTVSEGQFRRMMRGVPNPVGDWRTYFAGGTTPDPAGAGYPHYDELLSRLTELRQETLAWLQTIAEDDLDQPSQHVPPGFEPLFGTWRSCLLMQSLHWMNHRGQLADCRRAAGRERMMA